MSTCVIELNRDGLPLCLGLDRISRQSLPNLPTFYIASRCAEGLQPSIVLSTPFSIRGLAEITRLVLTATLWKSNRHEWLQRVHDLPHKPSLTSYHSKTITAHTLDHLFPPATHRTQLCGNLDTQMQWKESQKHPWSVSNDPTEGTKPWQLQNGRKRFRRVGGGKLVPDSKSQDAWLKKTHSLTAIRRQSLFDP